jgi:hypothetical protein
LNIFKSRFEKKGKSDGNLFIKGKPFFDYPVRFL